MVYRSHCRYLPYSIHFSEVMSIFVHEKTEKTRKYSKSAIFLWYENGRRWLLGAQSINTEVFDSTQPRETCGLPPVYARASVVRDFYSATSWSDSRSTLFCVDRYGSCILVVKTFECFWHKLLKTFSLVVWMPWAILPISHSAPKYSSLHFVFDRKCACFE